MSMTGSLMGYENNNEVNQAKCKKPLKPLPVVTSVNATGVTSTSKVRRSRTPSKRESCIRGHVNSLWSVWYGVLAVALQAYIAIRCAKRFFAYLSLPWPADAPPPTIELHACLVLAGAGVLLLPVLLTSAFLKLGNLANDGVKLGRHLSTCTRDPPTLLTNNPDNGLASNLWRHGGPTAAFVHLCTAMCFLLPSLLMEARLIHAGFLPKEAIWRTDLDWVVIHRDRLVVLSFMNPPGNLSGITGFITPQPYVTAPPYELETEAILSSTTDLTDFHQESISTDSTESFIKKLTSAANVYNPVTKSAVLPPSIIKTAEFTTPSTTSTTGSTSTVTSAPSTTAYTTTRIITTPAVSLKSTEKPSTSPGATSTKSSRTTISGQKRTTAKVIPRNGTAKGKAKKNTLKPTALKLTQVHRTNLTAQSLPSLSSLADLDNPENINLEFHSGESYGPITLEYLNYAIALGVYSVRYPAVFWSCNKALGTIFSLQLVANSAQSLLAYAGMSVLYKVQVVGLLKVLPHLRHRTVSTASTISTFLGDSYFLLNPHVTLALFALSSLLVLCSSMVMYLYAHGRFVAFLNQERERRVILAKDGRDGSGWGYFTHCAALCVFLAIAICSAPLLYDYTVIYRGSLDGAILACIVGTVLHLFLWLVLWVFLMVKQKWIFKLRVTIGRATVRSARSVKLVTDVDLLSARDDEEGTNAPLLVVGNGRTYTISDTSPKKAIMSVIQKAAMERKARAQGANVDSVDGESTADGDEQIYWLRPKLRPSPAQSPSEGSGPPVGDKSWLNKKLKPKVTFNDLPSTSGSRNKGKARRGVADGGPDDDGDYATLRELPLMTSLDPADDSTSEENKINGGQTPRCLRRADSGMPHEELTPRSDSSNSPPLDGGSSAPSNTSSHSETSSGVHSNASNASNTSNVSTTSQQRRATSVDDLTGEPREEPQWRSCSLQRGMQPPTNGKATFSPPNSRPGTSQSSFSPQYANHVPLLNGMDHGGGAAVVGGVPAVILENPNEATVVIRRKLSRPKITEPLNPNEEPFGRSTNMRMTSFTENSDLRTIQASSATLPHYPTQPVVTYPHCSTMPLPHASHSMAGSNIAGSTGSCGSVPRTVPIAHTTVPAHTTLPSHHNGVRLLHGGPNPFVKRFPPVQVHTQSWGIPGHHTFPQAPQNKLSAPAQIRQSDRDSANFSMASSGDSDTCLPH